MKAIIFLLFVALAPNCLAQTGLGTLTPNPSAILDVSSTNKGVLFPRVSLLSTTDTTTMQNGNVNGLVVYNSSTLGDISAGYYYWNAGKWNSMTSLASISGLSKLAFSRLSTGPSVKMYRDDQAIPGLTFSYSPVSDGTLDISANIYSTLTVKTTPNMVSNTLIKIKVNGVVYGSGINCPIVLNNVGSNPSMIAIRSAVPVKKGQNYNFEVTASEVYLGSTTDAASGSSSGTVSWTTYSAMSSIVGYLIQD